jgi:hypothetical protein
VNERKEQRTVLFFKGPSNSPRGVTGGLLRVLGYLGAIRGSFLGTGGTTFKLRNKKEGFKKDRKTG